MLVVGGAMTAARALHAQQPERSPTLFRFSTPGRAFHSASNRLALSGAACSSSFDATEILPSLTVVGALRHSVIPSLPMI
jgi:hypothetical protein